MTEVLFSRRQSPYHAGSDMHDAVLEAGAIPVDQNGYTAGLDRVFNTKGLKNMHTEIENTGGANGLTYTIEAASKEYVGVPTDLADADFDNVIVADTNVAFGATDKNDIIDVSPELTAIRIRIKRQVAGNDTTLAGIVSAN